MSLPLIIFSDLVQNNLYDLDIPKKIILERNFIFYSSLETTSSIRYSSGKLVDSNYHLVDLTYSYDSRELDINSIFNGVKDFKINDLTKKTIKTFIELFDVNSICFNSVSEKRTSVLLEPFDKTNFGLEELIGFEKSPFLKNLGEFGYNRILTNMSNYSENATSDNDKFVSGFR
jgi:hypothetical protein